MQMSKTKGDKMIKKLKQTVRGFYDKPSIPTAIEFFNKINELIDVVNKLHTEAENNARIRATHESNINTNKKKISNIETQTDVIFNRIDILNFAILDLHTPDGENKAINNIKKQTEKPEPSDPYAEQRKWIGKLCKFWDYDDEKKWFSILELIDKNSPYSYCASGDWWYKHCEPVKPDDDIIYKGE